MEANSEQAYVSESSQLSENDERELMQTKRKLVFEKNIQLDGNDMHENSTNESSDSDCYAPNMNEIHSKLPEEVIPSLGMEFRSEDEAHDFYRRYAKVIGFGIRKHKSHKNKKDKSIILDRIFCCACEGSREKDKRYAYVRRHRALTRTGCKAMMKLSARATGVLTLVKFEPQHNHHFTTPSKTHFLPSHRNITLAQGNEIDMACSSGIGPKESMELMTQKAGGKENLGFLRIDCNNYLRKKREIEMKVGDTGGVLEYLQRKQIENSKFFYAIQVDVDDLITNIFWADARMMCDYECFGDVVCFDTTYKKNKDGRPFAMFVGVNHHKQTIIFGAALLYDETTETFQWLFDTFVKAMQGKKPKTILTDQDQAMANALASKWPETYHRLCVWHIYQNAAKHLHHVFEGFKDFAKDFSSCVYDHDDEEDFISAWEKMLQKYNLANNAWLQRLFTLKEKWALVYGRQTFCADMSTTQRSESMNSQVKRYINYNNHLCQFFQHFERLLRDRRYDEKAADYRTKHTFPYLPYPVQILKHAATVYTAEVFESFQAAIWKAWDCIIESEEVEGTIYRYNILPPRRNVRHLVIFNSETLDVSCSCRKFDFVGVLCSHALKVFSSRNVTEIPSQYILKRWKKDAKVGIVHEDKGSTTAVDEKTCSMIRSQELGKLYDHLVNLAAESEETYKYAFDVYKTSIAHVEQCLKKLIFGNDADDDSDGNNLNCEQVVHKEQCDVSKAKGIKLKGNQSGRGRGRGRGKSGGRGGYSRYKSSLEIGRNRKKHCSTTSKDQAPNRSIASHSILNSPLAQEGYVTPLSESSQYYAIGDAHQHVNYSGNLSQQSSLQHIEANTISHLDLGSGSLTQLLHEQMSAFGAQQTNENRKDI